jgi:hypothetical protein
VHSSSSHHVYTFMFGRRYGRLHHPPRLKMRSRAVRNESSPPVIHGTGLAGQPGPEALHFAVGCGLADHARCSGCPRTARHVSVLAMLEYSAAHRERGTQRECAGYRAEWRCLHAAIRAARSGVPAQTVAPVVGQWNLIHGFWRIMLLGRDQSDAISGGFRSPHAERTPIWNAGVARATEALHQSQLERSRIRQVTRRSAERCAWFEFR